MNKSIMEKLRETYDISPALEASVVFTEHEVLLMGVRLAKRDTTDGHNTFTISGTGETFDL